MTKFDDIMNSDIQPEYKQIERALAEKYGIDPDAILPKFPQKAPLTDEEREYIAVAEKQRDSLYSKLEAGYEAIERLVSNSEHDPAQVREYERFWIALKREYDQVCDELCKLL